MSRLSGNSTYNLYAEQLIDDIIAGIGNTKNYNIEQGLAGIGLGIDYLIENDHVKGNNNEVLEDIDNALFKQTCYPDIYDNMSISLQLQFLYYFIVRLKKQNADGKNEFLFRELIIHAVNVISERINSELFEEQGIFDIKYPLPQYLFVAGACIKLYKDKVYRMLKEISPYILSKIPTLHANRLYLLYSMSKINSKLEIEKWDNHIKMLARETDIDFIIENELVGNIFFSDGLPAIYMFLSELPEYFGKQEVTTYKNKIVNKIEDSSVWKILLENEKYLKRKCGLFSGYPGTSILIQKHYKSEN
ncbi:hypothetical protein FACS1894155_12030 [Bacteroidia bacterium]|nr:hypothetical protein FACS1894155_12030 [Bacteroidia bacterium]